MVQQREKGVGIAQQILDAGNAIKVIRERSATNISFSGEITLVDETPQAVRKVIADDCYYYGYWLGDAFWMDFPKVIPCGSIDVALAAHPSVPTAMLQVSDLERLLLSQDLFPRGLQP